MKFAKIDRSSVTEQIIEYLKDQIFKQKLKPGQQLPSEENLALQLGVGRGTVREALRVLVYLGLIERRNKSTYVSAIASSSHIMEGFLDRIHKHRDVEKIIEVRRIIEPEAVALAAENATPEELEIIAQHLAKMEESADNYKEFIIHDEDFHRAIFSACGNHILMEINSTIQHYMHQNQELVVKLRPGIIPHSLDYHRKILKGVKEGKAEEVRKIMKDHIDNIESEMNQITKTGEGLKVEEQG
ncbi:MAG: FadR/GntR family transcriptional regulator [Spirochaetia bacterium]|jgi:GntR family transcriptional repressor for pyruvate dehydrogenase complex|nr:FadR/GntR family transcriptional regulator [Spirochaetia bacterium]